MVASVQSCRLHWSHVLAVRHRLPALSAPGCRGQSAHQLQRDQRENKAAEVAALATWQEEQQEEQTEESSAEEESPEESDEVTSSETNNEETSINPETESKLKQPEIETVEGPEIEDLDFIDDILEDTSNILDSIQETEKTIKILINREQKNN